MSKIEIRKVHTLTGHRDCVYTVQPADTSNVFFSGSGDGMIVSWDLTNPGNGELIAKLPNSVYALHHHAASGLLIAGHNYDGIHVLDWQNKKEVGSLQVTKAAIFDMQSIGDDLFVATGDGTLFKVAVSSLFVIAKVQASTQSARTIAIHPTRGEMAVGYSDHSIRVFDLDTLEEKYSWVAHR